MKCIKHTFAMRRATMLLLMLLTVCTTWAQDPVTLSDVTVNDIGKVVSTDGNIYATADDVTSGYPVAMIAYVDEQNHTGLAIAIEDTYFIENSTYKSYFQWTEAASAVTTWAADKAVTGCTWKVPTIQEWQMMLIGCGAEGQVSDEPSSGVLSFAGIKEMVSAVAPYATWSTWYWSATESSETAKSIEFSDTYAGFYNEAKTNHNSVRACLTFGTSGGESSLVNINATTADIGKFVCTDGTICSIDGEPSARPVAMIAYVDEQNHTGLAISIEDVNVTDGSESKYSFQWAEAADAVATWATDKAVSGCTWKVPTLQEWQQMLIGCGSEGTVSEYPSSNTFTFTGINDKLSALYQYTLIYDYWTATESSCDAETYARMASFDIDNDNTYAAFYTAAKSNTYSVRACLAFTTNGSSGGGSGTANTYVSTFEQEDITDSQGNLVSNEGNNWAKQLSQGTSLEYIAYDDGHCIAFHTTSEYWNGTELTPAFQVSGELSTITIKASGTIGSIILNENGETNDGVFTKTEGAPFNEYTLTPESGVSLNSITIVGKGDFFLKSITIETASSGGEGGNVIDSNTGSIRMPVTGIDEYSIARGTTSFKIYDDGGILADYSPDCYGTVILTAPTGCKLQLSGTITSEYGYDQLMVWDGTSDANVPDYYVSSEDDGVERTLDTFTSTGESLRLTFSSNSETSYAGLNLTVKVLDPSKTYNINVESATGGNVYLQDLDSPQSAADQSILMYISPSSGYMVEDVSIVDAEGNNVSMSDGKWYSSTPYASFTMPYADVTVTPTFTSAKTAAQGLYMTMPVTSDIVSASIPEGVQSFKLYDDGGPDNNYGKELNSTVTLIAPENYLLQLTGTITALSYEKLTVQDGRYYNDTKLFEAGSSDDGVTTDIGAITSTSRYMRITFQTYSLFNDYEGLDLTVTLINNASENNITITPANDGSVVAKIGEDVVTTAKVNDIVTLIATPKDEYVLTGITVTDANNNPVSVTGGTWYNYTATFKMPATAVTVTPVFEDVTHPDFSINMPTSGTLEATIPENVRSFKVYDDGGKNGAYQGYTNGVLVLKAPEDRMLHLKGTVATNPDSRLTVWDDIDDTDNDAKLISGAYSQPNGEQKVGGVVTSDQYMTLRFDAGFNLGPWEGLDLTVTQVDVVLDDQADNSDVISQFVDKGSGFNVALKGRTLYRDGGWNTICLPFSINFGADEVTSGAELLELQEASINGTVLNLTFGEPSSGFVPNTPYIIRWNSGDDIVCPLFTGVQFIDYMGGNYDNDVSGSGRVRFIGTYKGMTFDQEDKSILLMGADNQLFYPQPNGGQNPSLGAFRAYFKIGEDGSQQARQLTGFNITFDGEATTGIIETTTTNFTNFTNADDAWYSLDGRKLQGKPTKRGVYLNNGKKVVVK